MQATRVHSLPATEAKDHGHLTFRRKLKTELFIISYDTSTLGRHRCARFTCDGHFARITNLLLD